MTRLSDQVSFRVTPEQRRLIRRAARLSEREPSEWVRLVVLTEAEIQIQSKAAPTRQRGNWRD